MEICGFAFGLLSGFCLGYLVKTLPEWNKGYKAGWERANKTVAKDLREIVDKCFLLSFDGDDD